MLKQNLFHIYTLLFIYKSALASVSKYLFIYENAAVFYFCQDKFCFTLKQNIFYVSTRLFIYENTVTFVFKYLFIYKKATAFCICIIFNNWQYKTNYNFVLI